MKSSIHQPYPAAFAEIESATLNAGFTMASDPLTGSLLRTLAASKPAGKFLELGTGTGLSTSWILDGMDDRSSLISIDNEASIQQIAKEKLGNDHRLTLILEDAGEWILKHQSSRFDFIFADTWHGKYLMLEEGLSMLNRGGIYLLDDMLPQPNWPEGHQEKAEILVAALEERKDIYLTKQHWATGIIIAVKK